MFVGWMLLDSYIAVVRGANEVKALSWHKAALEGCCIH